MTKGYPRTRFDLVDQTSVQEISQAVVASQNIPLAMLAYTSDKGPENWRVLYGFSGLTDQIGPINFNRHGQAQLSLAELLRAGGAVLCKRMVSDDATLANITVHARVALPGDDAAYLYFYTTTASVGTFEEACDEGYANFDMDLDQGDEVDVPLFTVAASGRGISNLYFRIVPSYTAAKSIRSYLTYDFEVYEDTELLETVNFTMNPNIVIYGVSQAMNPKLKVGSQQVRVQCYDDGFARLAYTLTRTAVQTVNGVSTPITYTDLVNMDYVNGMNISGTTPIGGIVTIAERADDGSDMWTAYMPADISDGNSDGKTVVDLAVAGGIHLDGGSYGSMTINPMNNPTAYETALLGAFGANQSSGLFDTVIYDLDAYKVDYIADNNYPITVKNAICDLCDFRGDMSFLADMGTSVNNNDTIAEVYEKLNKSRYVSLYHNHFKIYDPYSARQIRVTMPFLLGIRMINHIIGGVGRPFAGIPNGITFPEIIENSINYLPVDIPGVDQKQQLVDMNVNYLSLYDGIPVMETMYVNTDDFTQLSYLHNIMGVQEVIKAVRTRCPQARYNFMDGNDLTRYIDDTTKVINQYSTNFKSISMQYMADEKYESNNIFYATITVQFKNFIHEEYFRVVAIS